MACAVSKKIIPVRIAPAFTLSQADLRRQIGPNCLVVAMLTFVKRMSPVKSAALESIYELLQKFDAGINSPELHDKSSFHNAIKHYWGAADFAKLEALPAWKKLNTHLFRNRVFYEALVAGLIQTKRFSPEALSHRSLFEDTQKTGQFIIDNRGVFQSEAKAKAFDSMLTERVEEVSCVPEEDLILRACEFSKVETGAGQMWDWRALLTTHSALLLKGFCFAKIAYASIESFAEEIILGNSPWFDAKEAHVVIVQNWRKERDGSETIEFLDSNCNKPFRVDTRAVNGIFKHWICTYNRNMAPAAKGIDHEMEVYAPLAPFALPGSDGTVQQFTDLVETLCAIKDRAPRADSHRVEYLRDIVSFIAQHAEALGGEALAATRGQLFIETIRLLEGKFFLKSAPMITPCIDILADLKKIDATLAPEYRAAIQGVIDRRPINDRLKARLTAIL